MMPAPPLLVAARTLRATALLLLLAPAARMQPTGGAALCWGLGVDGQLGDGRTGAGHFSAVPVRVQAAPAGEPAPQFQALSAGAQHVCGLASGRPYCWVSGTVQRMRQLRHAWCIGSKTGSKPPPLAVSTCPSTCPCRALMGTDSWAAQRPPLGRAQPLWRWQRPPAGLAADLLPPSNASPRAPSTRACWMPMAPPSALVGMATHARRQAPRQPSALPTPA